MSWWWCLEHSRPEQEPDAKADRRIGPYPDEQSARNWREQYAERNAQEERERADENGEDA